MSYIAKLLTASVTLNNQAKRITELEIENSRLKRQLGKARLWADMRQQQAEFDIAADARPALLRPQA